MVISIGSGLGIDEHTAEMVVLDSKQVDSELLNSGDACDRAVAALVDGDDQRAANELDQAPATVRRDALRGELLRMTGHPQQAIAAFVDLLAQHQPKGLRRATVLQHLGKAELAAGEHRAAIDHLELALKLRRTHGAPADQIASSELMVSIGEGALRRQLARGV